MARKVGVNIRLSIVRTEFLNEHMLQVWKQGKYTLWLFHLDSFNVAVM